jgi:hypothetical protein
MCVGCGAPPQDPDRQGITRTYAVGRLTALSNFVSDVTYWPNGLRKDLSHANGVNDHQSVTNMPRPSEISFGTYDRCVRPTFAVQPVSATLPTDGSGVLLGVTMSGTGPFTYQWLDVTHSVSAGTTASITVTPTATTSYYVTVSNACGFEQSQTAKVTAGGCLPPSTGVIHAVAQPDGSWVLTPNPVARAGATYSWKRLSDNAIVGNTQTLPIGVQSVTTSYQLTITDDCSSGTGTVTVSVPLPITAGLQATASLVNGQYQVGLVWPAISGATSYTIERRNGGGPWDSVGSSSATTFTDAQVAAAQTYVYRVTSNNGGKTDYDVATTAAFVEAASRQTITPAPMNSMLDAVNKVRAAAGWPAVTWANILAANDPVPAPGAAITARQLVACRVRMDEALQALGVAVRNYTDSDVLSLTIKALYINEVEQRAQ